MTPTGKTRLACVGAAIRKQLRVTRRAPNGKPVTQSGVALIAAMAAIVVLYGLMVNFSYATNIDYQQAGNARDDMVARFYVRSAMNLSRVVMKVQKDVLDRFRKEIGDVQLADYLPMFMGAFGGSKEEVAAFAEAIGGVGADELKGLGVPYGGFDLSIDTSDNCKANISCGGGSTATQELTALLLSSLVAPKDYDRVFEDMDGDGQVSDRQTLVRAIIDWADRDQAQYGANGAPEDYGYESRNPPYKARDNYYDSVDEVQLVRGMDERRWAMFGPSLTIYGGCRINVTACQDVSVVRAVIVAAAKNPNDPALLDAVNLNRLALLTLQAKVSGIQFDDLKAFGEFVAAPPIDNSDPTKPKIDIKGIELDQGKLMKVAFVGPRRIYRITGTAKVRKVEKKVVGVWDAETTNQNARDSSETRGAWLYWREE